jgi:hypothetical protein
MMLTEKEVSALLQVSLRTLATWRQEGRAPPDWKVLHGKIIRYPSAPLVAWINACNPEDRAPRCRNNRVNLGPSTTQSTGSAEARDLRPVFRTRRQKREIAARAWKERERELLGKARQKCEAA